MKAYSAEVVPNTKLRYPQQAIWLWRRFKEKWTQDYRTDISLCGFNVMQMVLKAKGSVEFYKMGLFLKRYMKAHISICYMRTHNKCVKSDGLGISQGGIFSYYLQ